MVTTRRTVLGGLMCAAVVRGQRRKPNFLLILADDHAGYVLGADGKTVALEGTKYFPDWANTAPHTFIDKVDFESGAKTRVFEASGKMRERINER